MGLFSSIGNLFNRKKKNEDLYSSIQNAPVSAQNASYMPKNTQNYSSLTQNKTAAPSATTKQYSSNYPTVKLPSIVQRPDLASGMTANYGQNPVNYQSPQTQTPAPAATLPFQGSVDRQRAIASDRRDFQQEMADRQAGNLEQIYNAQQSGLSQSAQDLQGNLDSFITRQNQRIEDLKGSTQEQKQSIRDQRGKELRRAAQTNRENQAGLQNLFAGLNVLDSSAFQNQASAQANRFTGKQNETLRIMTNELNQADRDLQDYRYQAADLVDSEIAKFNEAIRNIQTQMQVGSAEYNAAVQSIYDQAQQNIFAIEEGLAGFETSIEEKRAALENQLMEAQANQSGEQQGQTTQQVVNLIDDLLSRDVSGITGFGRYNPLNLAPGSDAQLTKNIYEQLKAYLSLDNIKYLKGTGQISDAEQRILANAASALGQNLSPEQFVSVLNNMKQQLASQGFSSGGINRPSLYDLLEQ